MAKNNSKTYSNKNVSETPDIKTPTEETVVETVENTEIVEEVTDAPVVEEVVVEDTPVEAPVVEEAHKPAKMHNTEIPKEKVEKPVVNKVNAVRVGDLVRLKLTAKSVVAPHDLPDFAYNNKYRVTKILDDRILLRSGYTYTVAVKAEDVVLV